MCSSDLGTGFSFAVSRNTSEPDYEGSIGVKKSYKKHNVDLDASASPTEVKLALSHEVAAVDGLKVGGSVENGLGADVAKRGFAVTADYKHSGTSFNFRAGQCKKEGKRSVTVSGAYNHNDSVVGLNAKIGVDAAATLTEAGLSVQHQAQDAQFSVAVVSKEIKPEEPKTDQAEDAKPAAPPAAAAASRDLSITVNVFHEYSAASQFGLEAVLPVSGGKTKAAVRAALQHKLADDEVLKARFELGGNNDRPLGLAYSTRLGAHTTLTASSDLDAPAILKHGLSNDSIRLGLKLSLNAE